MGLLSSFKKAFGGRSNDGPISLVMLLSEPEIKLKARLKHMAETTKDGDGLVVKTMPPLPPRQGETGPGAGAMFGVIFAGVPHGVIVCDGPYVRDVDAVARTLPRQDFAEAFRNHSAWVAVDWVGKPIKGVDPYLSIGMLARLFFPEHCTLLYMPARGRASFPTPSLVDSLSEEGWVDKFDGVGSDQIIGADADDEELAAATLEALKTLPTFIDAFESGRGEDFAVKTPFHDGETVEHMWVSVTRVTDEGFEGEIGNEPRDVTNVVMGQTVSVKIDDVEDWLFMRDGEMHGGYSVAVLVGRQ